MPVERHRQLAPACAMKEALLASRLCAAIVRVFGMCWQVVWLVQSVDWLLEELYVSPRVLMPSELGFLCSNSMLPLTV
jgi:hypothetical protein